MNHLGPYPLHDQYRWPSQEKIIGVVGVAPAATADFYQQLIRFHKVNKDWEHPRVLIDSNPKLPSRGRYFELGEADPSPYLRVCIENLLHQGADFAVVPCNTAHILFERFATGLPVIHMIDATIAALQQQRAAPQATVVFASRATISYDLYGKRLRNIGANSVSMDMVQSEVSALIEWVKQGRSLAEARQRFLRLVADFPNADAIIIGCTELSLLAENIDHTVVIDSNQALAQACLARAFHLTI